MNTVLEEPTFDNELTIGTQFIVVNVWLDVFPNNLRFQPHGKLEAAKYGTRRYPLTGSMILPSQRYIKGSSKVYIGVGNIMLGDAVVVG